MTAIPPQVAVNVPAPPVPVDGGDDQPGVPVSKPVVAAIGVLLFLSVPLLLYILIAFWPVHDKSGTGWAPAVTVFGSSFTVGDEPRFMLLVIIASAVGSFIAVATSFTTYLGNQKLYTRWIWWYVLRLPVGIALAVLFYLAVRGGFFAATASDKDVNPFGMAALGGLVGMFSKQAADKLQDVFAELFKSSRDAARGDKLTGDPNNT